MPPWWMRRVLPGRCGGCAADGRRHPGPCGCLSALAAQAWMSAPLSVASGLPDVALARRPYRRDRDGAAPWRVLRGMLLDADGVAVRRGCDEPAVGGSAHGLRADRAGDAMGRDAGDRFGLRADRRRPRTRRTTLAIFCASSG